MIYPHNASAMISSAFKVTALELHALIGSNWFRPAYIKHVIFLDYVSKLSLFKGPFGLVSCGR